MKRFTNLAIATLALWIVSCKTSSGREENSEIAAVSSAQRNLPLDKGVLQGKTLIITMLTPQPLNEDRYRKQDPYWEVRWQNGKILDQGQSVAPLADPACKIQFKEKISAIPKGEVFEIFTENGPYDAVDEDGKKYRYTDLFLNEHKRYRLISCTGSRSPQEDPRVSSIYSAFGEGNVKVEIRE